MGVAINQISRRIMQLEFGKMLEFLLRKDGLMRGRIWIGSSRLPDMVGETRTAFLNRKMYSELWLGIIRNQHELLSHKYRNKLNLSKPTNSIDLKENSDLEDNTNMKTLTIDNSDRIPHTNIKQQFWATPENKNEQLNSDSGQEKQK